jgi:CBS domain containing-hemolysin-like protein
MTASGLLWLSVIGWLVTLLAASGARVLDDFSRHELKEYCRRRGQLDFFSRILARHESLALAAETLLSIGLLMVAVSVGSSLRDRGLLADGSSLIVPCLLACLALLAAMVWIPRAVVRFWSAPVLYHSWQIWRVVSVAMWPLTLGFQIVEGLVQRLAGREHEPEDEEEAFEEEIRTIVTAGQQEGLLEAGAREMIESVIELGDENVRDIMTPRSELDVLDVSIEWDELIAFVTECQRTRIPVYQQVLDNVLGILHVKDLLPLLSGSPDSAPQQLQDILRPAWFVPGSKPVDELLREFQDTRNHMAIVVDEYQAVAGVVTIEDALEEIVGEIHDEHEREHELDIVHVNEHVLEVSGRAFLDELNEQLPIQLPEMDEYDTIAGLMIHQLGRIPVAQQQLVLGDVRITVLDASSRRVRRVRIEHLDGNGQEPSD